MFERYFKLSHIMLIALGLWPRIESMFKVAQRICFSLLFAFSIGLQFAKIITCRNDSTAVFRILSFTIPCLVFSLKYATFCVKSEDIKNLLYQVEHDWSVIKRKEEIRILEKCAGITNLMISALTILAYGGVFLFITLQGLPKILDAIVPLNESRSVRLLGVAALVFDQEKYFFPILIHMVVAFMLEVTTVLATESFALICIQHICGLFQIVSLRVEHALDCELRVSISDKCKIYRANIVNAIVIHDRALELCELFNSCIEVCYLLLLVLGVSSLSINLFRFSQAGYEKNMEEFFLIGIFIFFHLIYMFLSTLLPQIVTNYSADVYCKICQLPWYSLPLKLQKMISFMMQRSRKSFTIQVGGVFEGTLECFSSVISTSVSYFTVLWSMQHSS